MNGLSPSVLQSILPIRAVIDTCIFPQTRKWLGPLIDAAREGYLDPIWSPLIIAESNRVLTWLWLKRRGGDFSQRSWRESSADAKEMFLRLTRVFRVVDDRPPFESLWTDNPADDWDVPIWTAAKRSESSFIITENLADGPPKNTEGDREYDGITFMHPDDFLSFLSILADEIESEGLRELPSDTQLTERDPAPSNDFAPAMREYLTELLERKFGGHEK